MSQSGRKGRAIYFEPGSKPWLIRSLKHYVKDRTIEKAEYRLLSALAYHSTPEGELWWWSLADIEEQAALSNGGAKKSLKGLERKGILTKEHANRGYTLPDGSPATMSCIIYRLTRGVTNLHGGQALNAQALNAQALSNQATSAQSFSNRSVGNSLPSAHALSAVPLRSVDPKKNKKEKRARAPAPDQPLSLQQRLKKLSLRISNDEPIDPWELRKLVAESIEDGIGLTGELRKFLSELERRKLAELTILGKIELLGWEKPSSPSALLLGNTPQQDDENLTALVAETKLKLKV